MGHPLISIIVNVFNGERYLGQRLDNIRRLQGGFPLEVIVVDDASSDGTAKIFGQTLDAGFEIVRLAENIGRAAAINHAFELVPGGFVHCKRMGALDRCYYGKASPNFRLKRVIAFEPALEPYTRLLEI